MMMTIILGVLSATVGKFHCYWGNVLFGAQYIQHTKLKLFHDPITLISQQTNIKACNWLLECAPNKCFANWIFRRHCQKVELFPWQKFCFYCCLNLEVNVRNFDYPAISTSLLNPSHLRSIFQQWMINIWEICKRNADFSLLTSKLLNLQSYCEFALPST